MKMNMKKVLEKWHNEERKKSIPILTFPIAQKMGVTIPELLNDSDNWAKGMKMLADQESVDVWAYLTYMDLSVETEAFGGIVDFKDTEVPNVAEPVVKDRADVDALRVPEVGEGRTGLYIEGCVKAIEAINDPEIPVLAGCIGPFSLAGRLMDITEVMMKMATEPDTVHALLEKATEFIMKYVKAYKDAGANGICMAEPLAGLMSPKMLGEFSTKYVKRIIDSVQDDSFACMYHNCGSSTIKAIDQIVETDAVAFHFGNAINMKEMVDKFPSDKIVMGNVDPATQFCNGTPESVREETLKVMNSCCDHKNFIISSGCDIPANSPWENIDAFFAAVNEFYENR